MTVNLTHELMFFLEKDSKSIFPVVSFFLPQQGDVVVPKWYEAVFSARRYEGFFTAWVQQPPLAHHITLSQTFTAMELSKCLCSCWWNCLSLNPHINRVCHPEFELPQTQLCRCDHPVYCLYKCLIIYLTSAHQPWYRSCSRTHIQGFCWTLFRVMWKRNTEKSPTKTTKQSKLKQKSDVFTVFSVGAFVNLPTDGVIKLYYCWS